MDSQNLHKNMNIFDSRNTVAILFVLGCTLVMLIGLGTFGLSNINTQYDQMKTLEQQQNKWQQNLPPFYSYTFKSACMFVIEANITAANNQIVSPDNNTTSIDELFTKAKKAISDSHKFTIKYHPKYGFPELIEVDWSAQATDDECSYKVSDFTIITTSIQSGL